MKTYTGLALIQWHKARARAAYRRYYSVLDALDCGIAIGLEISSTARSAAVAFDHHMDRLKELGEIPPQVRLTQA